MWILEVWVHPVPQHSAREYAEIKHVQCKDFINNRVESLAMDSQRVRILISKGYRAYYTMLETLNTLQREPQQWWMQGFLKRGSITLSHTKIFGAMPTIN